MNEPTRQSLFVGYYRVSTTRQMESGLGSEAQKSAVHEYVVANGGRLVAEFSETVSGSTLRRPPLAVWREHESAMTLRLPQDRMKFWISFLPEDERTLRPDGIHLNNIRYWSPALTADLGRGKGRLLVKYDPRDLSRIFVRRPSGNFVDARVLVSDRTTT